MSCKYSNFEGKCEFFNDVFEIHGCDSEGNCICEDDEDPIESCEDYCDLEE